ncbi:FtsW/RodA/SpoVE family cell cycle protein [Kurthia sibirica]|uniref:Probable peptidoglycan glycosyltransferase FtsW n=1 Tax=Kurthia sibirica TaxID=202750 RepID=A0A2U3AQJ9_9BACL|nr:FtsW/RodA/SpoVE family cell cycle protein [Kurthia sibirica]PWI26789.1 cell division protein FtsW [Kurthia sibirica]GEK32676.1 cell division protein FtsW [Kurthia sibirica]
MKKYFKEFDYPLFITYVALCLFGLIMVYSSSMMVAVNKLNLEPDYFYKKQIFNIIIAFIAFFIGCFIPYKRYRNNKFILIMLVSTFVLLILVHLIGYSPDGSGAKSWLKFSFASFQPSELAKISIIIYFSVVFANKNSSGTIDSIMNSLLPPMFIYGLAVASIAMEPDIGSIILLTLIAFSVIAVSGLSIKKFIISMTTVFLIGVGVIGTALLFFKDTLLTEKRMGRIEAFWDPFKDITNYGWQVVNGYYAIGAGGIPGLGLGQSIQKLGYLPEPHTDFILAIISEELGTLGVLFVIGGLGFIVLRGIIVGIRAKDPMARMLAVGIASWIGFQTFVNIGGLSGLIPLTGVPLPFISYGGSSLMLLSLAMGILVNVSMFVKKDRNKLK